MLLFEYLKRCAWPTIAGYTLFIGMMATGYYYNVTFVQLGLEDLGTRVIGMSDRQVAMNMALLALVACIIALVTGWFMTVRGWSRRFVLKLRLAFVAVLIQTILTAVVPFVRSEQTFLVWVLAGSVGLGVGMPATFSLTVDLIPVRDRGYVAALITAVAYFAAAVLPTSWEVDHFATQMLVVMPPGLIVMGILAFTRVGFLGGWLDTLAQQHEQPAFACGRFVPLHADGSRWLNRDLFAVIALMFGIFFIDSLGFLRLIKTPIYMETAWQSADLSPRLAIAGFHVLAAFVGGVLYTALDRKHLFFWVFGIFALVHMQYGLDLRLPRFNDPSLGMPILYAVAVSLYTVINFAVWADLSTPRTIGWNAALGVALSGWAATFISTALSIQWRIGGMSLGRHLSIVDALAMLFFLGLLGLVFMRGSRPPESSEATKGVHS